jgi:hypothetical protein
LISPVPGKLDSVARAAAVFLAVLALGGAVVVATAMVGDGEAAKAKKPCWERMVDDWTQDQRVDGRYSAACINEALRKVPEDVRAYSSFEDEARAARIEGSRTLYGSGGGGNDSGDDGSGGGSTEPGGPRPGTSEEGLVQRALGADGNNADSVPLPLLILLGLATALITAGGAGFAARKVKALRASR